MTELTVILALTAAVFGGHPVKSIQARNGTTARDFVVEPATLICLGSSGSSQATRTGMPR